MGHAVISEVSDIRTGQLGSACPLSPPKQLRHSEHSSGCSLITCASGAGLAQDRCFLISLCAILQVK